MRETTAEPSSLLQQLRAATRPEHLRLEELLPLPQSIEQHISRLKKFYGFHVVWEPLAQSRLASLEPTMAPRRKLPLLAADLAHFGIHADQLLALPICDQLPAIHDLPTALGSMYVMEGSTLGGQIISRHLEATLGLRGGSGYSYYQSYGSNVGKLWREFLAQMDSHTESENAPSLIDAALQTFTSLHRWFSQD
jgi:heme oxygenase (biliverdin-IX-beta and delta-forming)